MKRLSFFLSEFQGSNIKSFLQESFQISKEFIKIAFPQILFCCSLFLQGSLNIFFISFEYKDQDMLNAIGISNLYVNITTGIILKGIAGALDTLASNAYGAKNYKLLGIYNDRCRYISLIYWGIILIFHYFCSRSVLSLLKVEERVIDLALEYVSIFVFSYIFTINFQINTNIFVLIEKAHINLYISIGSLLLHTFDLWLFICVIKCGIRGASIAVIITSIFNLASSTYFVHHQNLPEEALVFLTKEGLRDWYSYLRIAVPGIIISGGEWLGFEIQGMTAIFISPLAYSTTILTMNLECLMFPYTAGISAAISMKAGEKLISEDSRLLKRYITICYLFSLFMSALVLCFVGLFGNEYFYLMSPNVEIYENCIKLTKYVCYYIVIDNGYYFFIGVLKAIGYLRNPTIVSFFIFYVVEISITYLLSFKLGLEVKGIWCSLGIGGTIGIFIFVYWIYSFDMEEMKQKALERLKKDHHNVTKNEGFRKEIKDADNIIEVRERLLLEEV